MFGFKKERQGIAKYKYETIALISGAAVMIFEIAGARLVAPYFGTSSYVWTSIIGVILGALSLGYWLGGKAADKYHSDQYLAKILFLSGLLIGIAYAVTDVVLAFIVFIPSYVLASFIGSIVLFAPTSVCLGMITPLIVRIVMHDVEHSGRTVGNLYAISTVGSIIGTFVAGYFLLPLIGTRSIFLGLALIMLALAFFAYSSYAIFKPKIHHAGILLVLILAVSFVVHTARAELVDEFDTLYSHVRIAVIPNLVGDNRDVQVLQLNAEYHSGMYTDDPIELTFPYVKHYRLAEAYNPGFETALMIGGGAFSFPKYYTAHYPTSTIDVIEIDTDVIDAARRYFHLEDHPNMSIHAIDGRMFIDRTENTYDVIYGDAFSSYYSIPFHLTTDEATKRLYELTNPGGVLVVNVIGSLEGPQSQFFRSYVKTLKETYGEVDVFHVETRHRGALQNLMVVACKDQCKDVSSLIPNVDEELAEMLQNQWAGNPQTDLPILTDDHAPVEYYMRWTMRRHN